MNAQSVSTCPAASPVALYDDPAEIERPTMKKLDSVTLEAAHRG